MEGELIQYQSSDEQRNEELPEALWLLKNGFPVALDIKSGMAKPSRRLGKSILFIAPLSAYVSRADGYLFSLEGGGCTASTIEDLKSVDLQLMGLSAKSAKLLVEQLKTMVESNE